jgi:hypothetical protein
MFISAAYLFPEVIILVKKQFKSKIERIYIL